MINLICKIISLITLVVLIVPSCLYMMDKMSLDQAKGVMFIATIVWYVTASVWMFRNKPATDAEA